MELSPQLIPAWFVAFAMLYTALIWLLSMREGIKIDARQIAYTLAFEGLVYYAIFEVVSPGLEIRGFYSRVIILVICLSQSLPLTISYMRNLNDGK